MEENLRDKLERVNRGRQHEEADREARYRKDSRSRFRSIVKKKITTSFIGAISQFEHYFGDLWGHKLPAESCSKDQLNMRTQWELCRKDVLNTGNNQLRGIDSELEQHDVVWNRYQTQFRVHTEGNEDGCAAGQE